MIESQTHQADFLVDGGRDLSTGTTVMQHVRNAALAVAGLVALTGCDHRPSPERRPVIAARTPEEQLAHDTVVQKAESEATLAMVGLTQQDLDMVETLLRNTDTAANPELTESQAKSLELVARASGAPKSISYREQISFLRNVQKNGENEDALASK